MRREQEGAYQRVPVAGVNKNVLIVRIVHPTFKHRGKCRGPSPVPLPLLREVTVALNRPSWKLCFQPGGPGCLSSAGARLVRLPNAPNIFLITLLSG